MVLKPLSGIGRGREKSIPLKYPIEFPPYLRIFLDFGDLSLSFVFFADPGAIWH